MRVVARWVLVVVVLLTGRWSVASTWTNGAGDNSWNNPANWTPSLPNGVDAIADFSAIDLTLDPLVTLDGAKTVGTLILGDTVPSGNNWTLGSGSGGGLTLSSATPGQAKVTVNTPTATLNFAITNAQGFIKDGPGMLILTAQAGAGTGNITIKQGSVSVQNLNYIGATPGAVTPGNVILDGGTLNVRGPIVVGPSSTNRGMLLGPAGAGNSGFGTFDVTITDPALAFIHNGILANNSGGTGGLIKTGAAGLTLGGANTYTGPTQILAGFLRTGNLKDGGAASGIGASSNAAGNLVLDGGSLQYTGAAQSTNRLFTLGVNGGTIEANGTGALTFSNNGAVAFSGAATARTLTLSGSSAVNNVFTNTVFTPTLADNGAAATSLVKDGPGMWSLASNNTYSGGTTINAGTLRVGNGQANGSLGTGPVTNNGTLSFNRSDNLTVPGAISGVGAVLKQGSARITLSGANTYTGDTTIEAGALSITGSLSPTGNVLVNAGATFGGTGAVGNVTLQTDGNFRPGATQVDGSVGTLTVSALNVNGGDMRFDLATPAASDKVVVTNAGAANFNGLSTITPTGSPAFGTYTLLTSGALGGTAPTLNVPAGTRTTYALHFGDVEANAITLDVGGGPKSITWTGANGNAWNVQGAFNWKDAANVSDRYFNQDTVTFDTNGANRDVVLDEVVQPASITVNSSNDYSISSTNGTGGIAGETGLTKLGSGKLTLRVNNTYTGTTTISAGTIQLGSGGDGSGTLGTGLVVNDAALVFNRSDQFTVPNAISGSGVVQQVGTNIAVLAGANTYSGATTISSGFLQIGDGGTAGTLGTGQVTNNGTLMFNRSDSLVVPNLISGTGTVRQDGPGITILTANNSYGATQINAGTLQVGNGGATGSLGTGPITDNGTLAFNRSDPLTLSAVISGGGGVLQLGTGLLTFNAVQSYTGPTTIAGPATLAAGATLGGGGSVLTMGSGASVGNLDLSNTGAMAAGLAAASNSASPNVINLGNKTLTVPGNVLISYNGGAILNNSVTVLNVTGSGGSLVAGDGIGGSFIVGNQSGAANSATTFATLDLSGLTNVTIDYGAAGQIGLGTTAAFGAANGPGSNLNLGANNTLRAGTLRVSYGAVNAGTNTLRLGTTNVIDADTIVVAGGKGPGNLVFNTGLTNPTVKIRGVDGVARVAEFKVGDYSDYSSGGASTNSTGIVDLSAGSVDALIGNLRVGIGRIQGGGTAQAAGTVTIAKGTLDATAVVLGARGTSVDAANPSAGATGTLNVQGTANLVVGAGGVTLGLTNTGGGVGTGVLNVTGGTATIGADIADGGDASTVTLNGGTLDLQGHNLGTAAGPIDTLNFQGGTLRSAGQINDGASGVTKTTAGTLIVAGTNGYTGATTVSAGTLRVTGSIAASSGVTVSAGATFESAAAPAVVVKSLAIDNGGVAKVTAGVLKVGDNTNPTPLTVDGTGGNTAKVDLTNRGLIVDLPEGSDLNAALGSLRAQVIAGYAGGSWLGNGITSSTAAAAAGGGVGYALASEVASGGTFMGAPVDGSAGVARYTLYGDSTLDGTVDFNDLVKLAQNYNTTVSGTSGSWWFNGDYTYDGIVDFNDLVKLAQNYNTSLPAGAGAVPGAPAGFEGEMARAMSMVPEPSVLGILLVGLGLGWRGRKEQAVLKSTSC